MLNTNHKSWPPNGHFPTALYEYFELKETLKGGYFTKIGLLKYPAQSPDKDSQGEVDTR